MKNHVFRARLVTAGLASIFLLPGLGVAADTMEVLDGNATEPDVYGTFAPEIIAYFPLLAGTLAFVVCLGLHWFATRQQRLDWNGREVTWGGLWLVPCLAAAGTYALVTGAMVGLALTSIDFTNYARANAGPLDGFSWVVGLPASLSPFLVRRLVRPRGA